MLRINGRHEAVTHTVYHEQGATDFILSGKYSQLEFVAYGGFSVVCKATNTENNTTVAIKYIDLQISPNILSVLREIKVSKYLTKNMSKAIVELQDIEIPATKDKNKWAFNKVYLMYEYVNSTLHQTIRSNDIQTEEDNKRLPAHLLFGIRDMHHANILHRDLKPSNMLVDTDGKGAPKLKICDFGLARAMRTTHSRRLGYNIRDYSSSDDDKNTTRERKIVTMKTLEQRGEDGEILPYEDTSYMIKAREIDGLTNRLGTAGYRSPELTLGCQAYQKPSDIWAIGCIFAEMVKKTRLFQVRRDGTNEEEFNAIISKFGSSFITSDLEFIDNPDGLKLAERKIAESIIGSNLSEEFEGILDKPGIRLLQKLLRFDPRERIKAQNALKTTYLKDTHSRLKEEFKHLNMAEQFEYKEEQHESEDKLKEKMWIQMEDFHGYREVNDDEHNMNKIVRTL